MSTAIPADHSDGLVLPRQIRRRTGFWMAAAISPHAGVARVLRKNQPRAECRRSRPAARRRAPGSAPSCRSYTLLVRCFLGRVPTPWRNPTALLPPAPPEAIGQRNQFTESVTLQLSRRSGERKIRVCPDPPIDQHAKERDGFFMSPRQRHPSRNCAQRSLPTSSSGNSIYDPIRVRGRQSHRRDLRGPLHEHVHTLPDQLRVCSEPSAATATLRRAGHHAGAADSSVVIGLPGAGHDAHAGRDR